MLIEHVSRGVGADENSARVSIVEDFGRVVKNAPAGDHVVFIAVMFDMGDYAVRRSSPC